MFIYLTIEWTINVLGRFILYFLNFSKVSIDIIAYIILIEIFLMDCNLVTIVQKLFWLDFNMILLSLFMYP